MVRVRLKGVNRITKTLADGRRVTYHYAWKGGPRLPGEPGSPEFIAAFQEAFASRKPKVEGTFQALVNLYRESSEFTEKSNKTRRDYGRYLRLIEAEFGDLPISALALPDVRGDFKSWRDGFLPKKRSADYAWSVLARVCSVAKDRGKIPVNPCERGGRLYEAERNELIWTEDHLTRLLAVASPEVAAVVTVALWTGQRQGDVLAMTWAALAGDRIKVRQSKSRKRLVIPMGRPLRELFDSLTKHGPVVLTSSDERPWTSSGFRASFRRACAKAKIGDLHFHDLRGTAVTRLALAGCTVTEIAAITGHSLRDVESILEAHYLGGQTALAEAAIVKLEAKQTGGKSPN